MKRPDRFRFAALATAFFLGGVVAVGAGVGATRHGSPAPVTTVRPRTQVIHETRVRTIHVRPKRRHVVPAPAPAVSAATPPVQAQPVVAQAPAKVRSRVSPTGGHGHEGSDGSERGDD